MFSENIFYLKIYFKISFIFNINILIFFLNNKKKYFLNEIYSTPKKEKEVGFRREAE